MQEPSGNLRRFDDEHEAREVSEELEELTGKAHPVFVVGTFVEIRGGRWKVTKIMSRGRMTLKAVPY